MMSRRRSLVGAVSRGTQRFLVYLCVAALVAPVPAHAKRGKRTSEAGAGAGQSARSVSAAISGLSPNAQLLTPGVARGYALSRLRRCWATRPSGRGYTLTPLRG